MTTKYFDNHSSALSSTEIQVYEDYKDAPPISGVYVFEVEKGIVKCGMSRNVKKRFRKLVDIKKHREETLHGRVAILPVDEERLKREKAQTLAIVYHNLGRAYMLLNDKSSALKYLIESKDLQSAIYGEVAERTLLYMQECQNNNE